MNIKNVHVSAEEGNREVTLSWGPVIWENITLNVVYGLWLFFLQQLVILCRFPWLTGVFVWGHDVISWFHCHSLGYFNHIQTSSSWRLTVSCLSVSCWYENCFSLPRTIWKCHVDKYEWTWSESKHSFTFSVIAYRLLFLFLLPRVADELPVLAAPSLQVHRPQRRVCPSAAGRTNTLCSPDRSQGGKQHCQRWPPGAEERTAHTTRPVRRVQDYRSRVFDTCGSWCTVSVMLSAAGCTVVNQSTWTTSASLSCSFTCCSFRSELCSIHHLCFSVAQIVVFYHFTSLPFISNPRLCWFALG